MSNEHTIELYHRKFKEWKKNKREGIRFHYHEEAYDQIKNNDFLVFGGKFRPFEFYFLFISGSIVLTLITILGIFAFDELIGDVQNIVTLVTGVVVSLIFIVIAIWYAIAVPKFCLVLGPEGFLYKRHGKVQFYYWNEILDIRSYELSVRKRPNLKKKIILVDTRAILETERNVGKLPKLDLYLFTSDEFGLKEERRDKKDTELQGIIEKIIMEYWNSRKNN